MTGPLFTVIQALEVHEIQLCLCVFEITNT